MAGRTINTTNKGKRLEIYVEQLFKDEDKCVGAKLIASTHDYTFKDRGDEIFSFLQSRPDVWNKHCRFLLRIAIRPASGCVTEPRSD